MIAKLTLVSTNSPEHPMVSKLHEGAISLTGYLRDRPLLGNPIIIWYATDTDSSYIRTSAVQVLTEFFDETTGDSSWVATTHNSTYAIKSLNVHSKEEGRVGVVNE